MYPVLFEIFGFPISPYGILVAAGMLVAIVTTLPRTRQLGLPDEKLVDLAVVLILSGLAGAKALYILTEWNWFIEQPLQLIFSREGLVFYGGVLGAVPALIWFFRKHGLPLWRMADALAPSVPLAHALGRVGCFFAGCCFGRVCGPDFPLGVEFPAREPDIVPPALYQHIEQGLVDPHAAHSLAVYPVQLFEAAALFALFLGLMWAWRRRKFDGQIFLLYLAVYGVIRILMEQFRGDIDRGVAYEYFSTSTLISAGMLAAAGWFWFQRKGIPPQTAPLKHLAENPSDNGKPEHEGKAKSGKRKVKKRGK